jgi:ribosome-binding factor A
VAERLKEELAELLVHELRDPRAAGVIVTRVEMPSDLRSAKVYFRLLEGAEREERREEALQGLGRAAGLLRREVTRRLQLRHAPELRFVYDGGLEKLQRIDELLFEIRQEQSV